MRTVIVIAIAVMGFIAITVVYVFETVTNPT
jgi:hypothetical protein